MAIPTTTEIEARLLEVIKRRPAITLRLDIINKCNLRCIMCHYSDKKISHRPLKYFTPEEFERLFADIAPHVCNVMLSCADEPLTSKYFPEILGIVANYPPLRRISLCTNAMLMNARISKLMIEKGVTRVLLSMDGVTKSTMERIRVGSKYEQVVRNIMALRDLKAASGIRYPTMVMDFVMMNSNIYEAPVFVEMARRLGVEVIDFRHSVPTGYWRDDREMLSSHKAKFNYYREKIIEVSRLHKIEVLLPPPFDVTEKWKLGADVPYVGLSDFEHVKSNKISEEHIPIPKVFPPDFGSANITGTIYKEFPDIFCHRPFTDIQVRDFDEVLPCPWLKTTLGRLSDGKSLSEIFFGEEYQRLRRNMYLKNGDLNCHGCVDKADLMGKKVEESTQYQISSISVLRKKVGRLVRRLFF